jgi:hypothetical protein
MFLGNYRRKEPQIWTALAYLRMKR